MWTFSDIRTATRQISGQLDVGQLPNSTLDFYINNYYQLDLPREIKIEELYRQLRFSTLPSVDIYPLSFDFTHVEPNVYIDGSPIFYTQNPNVYYSRVPMNFDVQQIGTGNGVTVTFTDTLVQIPIVSGIPNSVLVSAGAVSLSDDGVGNLNTTPVSLNVGTINYTTGAISVTFAVAPVTNTPIQTTYNFKTLGPPNTALFYQRQFQFYPCPDTTYQVRIDAYIQPTPLVNPNEEPLKPEWGELIAIGASMKILRDFGQFEKWMEMKPYYYKERSKVLSDTDNQLMASRSIPNF